MVKSCLRVDDGCAPQGVCHYCLSILGAIESLGIVTVEKPPDKPRCIRTLYEQQIEGLEQLPDGLVFAVESDVLYHPARFDFEPPTDDFWYQTHFYELTPRGYLKHNTGQCYSQMVARRSTWLKNLQARVLAMKNGWKVTWTEPGHADPPSCERRRKMCSYQAEYPDVGIRHGRNLSGDRKPKDPDLYITQIPYWGHYRELLAKLGMTELPKKLNVGSGCMLLPDYINFDTVKVVRGDKSTDVVGVAQDILKYFQPESFDEILCCHILEHLKPKHGKKLVQDCYKLLKPGGLLVVESPDVLKIIEMWNQKNPTFGDPPSVHKLMTFFYGWDKDQWRDYGYHQYGYTSDTMAELVESCGFKITRNCEGRMHGRRARDFRLEGVKTDG